MRPINPSPGTLHRMMQDEGRRGLCAAACLGAYYPPRAHSVSGFLPLEPEADLKTPEGGTLGYIGACYATAWARTPTRCQSVPLATPNSRMRSRMVRSEADVATGRSAPV